MVDRICDNCMSRVPADSDKCPRCGIRFENTNPGGALPNGWVLGGRYTVGRYIEIDGEGVTYSAIDGNTLQRVTIKEYMPVTLCATRDETGSIVAKPGNEVLFKTTRMDFRELYDTLLRMGLTVGLVQVLEVLQENNTAYAVLEKVEGPTLAEYLTKSDAPVEAARAMAILRPVMMGVESMHAANLVHRGISPDNIILESGGTAKLAGYATLALRQQGSELKPKLYHGYSAPEQYAASEFEGRYTDIYALGAVLYRMVTGEIPPSADERKMQDNLRNARAENKEVPNFMSTGISRAMRLIPAERIQNVADLRLALTGEGGRDTARGPLGLTKQQLIVAAVAAGAIVVLLLVILLVSIFSGKGGDDSTTTSGSTSLTTSVSGVENPVPNFVGQTLVWVQNKYGDEFTFDVEEKFDENVAAGYVISQDPAYGTEYVEGTKIKLVVSKGADPDADNIDMPDLVTSRSTVENARNTLVGLGLASNQIVEIEEANTGNYEAGTVIRTIPEAGQALNVKNGSVTLYVAGEKPVQFPNLYGMTLDAAKNELNRLGIPFAGYDWVDNPGGQYVYQTVVKASVDAGASYYPSSGSVTVYLARNSAMPAVIGVTEEVARQRLSEITNGTNKFNLTVQVQYSSDASINQPAGVVYNCNLNEGLELKDGMTVVLYVKSSEAAEG